MFVVWMLSFNATGIPCRGPRTLPAARSRSSRSASSSARASTASAAWSVGSYVPMRARYWRTSSRDVTRPSFMAACMSAMLASMTENLGFPAGARLDWVCTTATQEITTQETTTNGRVTGRRVTVMGPHDRSEPSQEVRRFEPLELLSVLGHDGVQRLGVPEAGGQAA